MATSCKKLLSNGSGGKVETVNKKPWGDTQGCKPSDSGESSDGNYDVSILSGSPNLYKQNGASMSQSFVKQIISTRSKSIRSKHPWAYLLAGLIAERVNRFVEIYDGLGQGEAYIGDIKALGCSRQNYRTAVKFLENDLTIKILETNRNRKKSTNGSTTAGTKVKLIKSDLYEVVYEKPNHRPNHCLTTAQPLPNHGLDRKKIRLEEDHPLTPSFSKTQNEKRVEVVVGVFLTETELEECVEVHGGLDRVRLAIRQLIEWPGRKYEITQWAVPIKNWQIKDSLPDRKRKNEMLGKKTEKEFSESKNCKIRVYKDNMKDDYGVLFEGTGADPNPFFISFSDADFERKLKETIKDRRMKKNESI